MNYVVAVSGGVDSVVLLDMLVRTGEHRLTVAHFDHGIRPESSSDAAFVAALARHYGVAFETERVELGPDCNEDTARRYRYEFLRRVAERSGSMLVTAHHQDDLVETIAINLTRGTGWRGLAVLNDPTIMRPLLNRRKSDIYEYALAHEIEWVEDETNQTQAYLRNRLRRKLGSLDEGTRRKLVELYDRQRSLAQSIARESEVLATYDRYFLTMVDESVAMELLRELLAQQGLSLTRPQRTRMLLAIKTARPGTTFQAGEGISLGFTTSEFIVKHP